MCIGVGCAGRSARETCRAAGRGKLCLLLRRGRTRRRTWRPSTARANSAQSGRWTRVAFDVSHYVQGQLVRVADKRTFSFDRHYSLCWSLACYRTNSKDFQFCFHKIHIVDVKCVFSIFWLNNFFCEFIWKTRKFAQRWCYVWISPWTMKKRVFVDPSERGTCLRKSRCWASEQCTAQYNLPQHR